MYRSHLRRLNDRKRHRKFLPENGLQHFVGFHLLKSVSGVCVCVCTRARECRKICVNIYGEKEKK